MKQALQTTRILAALGVSMGVAFGARTLYHRVRGESLPQKSIYVPLVPNAAGDGWISPASVTISTEDETKPSVAVDGNGTLWCTLVSSANSYNSGYNTVEIYRSTNQGFTWTRQAYLSVANADLSDPTLAIDVSVNKMYIAYLVKFEWASDYDLAWAIFDIEADTLANYQTGWLESSANAVSGSPGLIVERDYDTNYVFVAWSQNSRDGATFYFDLQMARSTDYGTTWTTSTLKQDTNLYLGQVSGAARDTSNPCVIISFKEDKDGMLADSCERAYLAISRDRGVTWSFVSRDMGPNHVYQSSVACAFGGPQVMWAFQVISGSNSDIYMVYSTDNATSWAAEYYLEDSVALLSKMPVLVAEGVNTPGYNSRYFYLLCYRIGALSTVGGNAMFKMAWDSLAENPARWRAPELADSLLINNLKAFSVTNDNGGQLAMTSRYSGTGYKPSIVWCHEYSTTDHDIYFSSSVDPTYDQGDERDDPARGNPFLRNPVNHGELLFVVPPEMTGHTITFYDAGGRMVATRLLAPVVNLSLPPGVYYWRVDGNMGRTVIKR